MDGPPRPPQPTPPWVPVWLAAAKTLVKTFCDFWSSLLSSTQQARGAGELASFHQKLMSAPTSRWAPWRDLLHTGFRTPAVGFSLRCPRCPHAPWCNLCWLPACCLCLWVSLPCSYSLSWECVTAAIQSYCSKPLLLYLSSWIPVLTKQQCAKPKSQSLRSDWWSQLWPSRKPSTYPVDQYRGPTAQVSVHRLFSLKKEVF